MYVKLVLLQRLQFTAFYDIYMAIFFSLVWYLLLLMMIVAILEKRDWETWRESCQLCHWYYNKLWFLEGGCGISKLYTSFLFAISAGVTCLVSSSAERDRGGTSKLAEAMWVKRSFSWFKWDLSPFAPSMFWMLGMMFKFLCTKWLLQRERHTCSERRMVGRQHWETRTAAPRSLWYSIWSFCGWKRNPMGQTRSKWRSSRINIIRSTNSIPPQL